MKKFLPIAALTVLIALPRLAVAHPHVFVDTETVLVFNKKGEAVSIEQIWQFDEMFSMTLIEDNDLDQNGTFDADDIVSLQENAFQNLAEYHYFTQLMNGGEDILDFTVSAFDATLNKDKTVTYRFTLDLPKALTPSDLRLGVFDPEYYVDFAYKKGGELAFKGQKDCAFTLKEDAENPIYAGMVNPEKMYVTCGGT